MPRILIVDDSALNLKIISGLLGDEYEVYTAANGEAAISLASEKAPDLILLDVIMPGMDGLAVCRFLKGQTATADIPIIFITVVSEPKDIVKALEAGGQDYITKPFSELELKARVKTHLELRASREALKAYASELEEKNLELKKALMRLEVLATTDYLTGLPNRRYMMRRISEEVARAKRTHGKMALVMADINKFKMMNDTYGHNYGDLILREIADKIKANLREQDVVARWGGDEFLLLLPDADLAGGKAVADKLKRSVGAEKLSCCGEEFSIALTCGAVQFDVALGIEANIKKADEALYRAKRHSH